jgi:hypothetical protein
VEWPDKHANGIGLMARAKQHTDYARFCRAAWDHPCHPAAINVTDCQVLGIPPGEGGHSMRHRGERPGWPDLPGYPGPGQNRQDATALDDPALQARPRLQPEPGAERDDLCGPKRVPLIISPCK